MERRSAQNGKIPGVHGFQEPTETQLHPCPEFHETALHPSHGDDKASQEDGEFLVTPSALSRSRICEARTRFSAKTAPEAWLVHISFLK